MRLKVRGTVVNIIANKNYGFILADNGQQYFFHREDLNGNWEQLCKDWEEFGPDKINVTFDARSTPKGPRAANVELIQYT